MNDNTAPAEACPSCSSMNTYPDAASLWTCAECFHEWNPEAASRSADEPTPNDISIRDSNGNILSDGDSVIVLKDLKVRGASSTIKSGTKVRNIRLIQDATDGHNFSCKIDGVGAVNLKSEFVKKSQ
jgi:protein PhnA